ncbi:hypothetical protein RFI_05929 [Reticulomyxa filosa]|uniref:CAP-Gly domain-containing protein n=1 Tax=Reticulomyxa filosa TaxID=46433 RepID=X6NY00_RETFI|nr:hypothetical protein RFI_05929 [Reticulomyxa filosa]|eukprot:ETO31190.1 hypothetical protein RFI_05929 [Reticulomyxa filosa]
MIGVEMDVWSANAHDGSLNGMRYFDATPGKGYFIRKESYMSLKDIIGDSDVDHILKQGSMAFENFDVANLGTYFEEQDYVTTSDGHKGKVVFIGKVKFSPQEMAGLILDEWDPNGHNGNVRGEKYFDAPEGYGWFVPVDKVTEKISEEPEAETEKKATTEKQKSKNKNRIKVEVGQRVQIKGGMRGLVSFYGKTDFSDNKWIGLQLDNWHYNAHDGTVNNKRYFTAGKGRGFFVRPESISVVMRQDEEKKITESLSVMPEIGDRVRTVRGKTGVVRFIGPVDFSRGVLIGVELDRWSPNATDGSVNGVPYFDCMWGRGYFTCLSNLIENLGSALQSSTQETTEPDNKADSQDDSLHFKFGDKIQLSHRKIGVIRFIGTTEATGTDEIIGIELDSWDVNAKDGSIGEKVLFDVSYGRGYFARRKAISNAVRTRIKKDSYAKLKGLQSMTKFNGRVVKTIEYVQEKQRWKVKLYNNNKKKEKKHLGVKEENLTPLFDWEIPSDSAHGRLTRMPLIGDHVRTRDGAIGTVRFLGKTDFSKDQIAIGIELDEWQPSANNGSVNGKEFFKCKDGYGYFASLDELEANLGQYDGAQPQAAKPTLKVGDKVKLARGKIGEVRFIGKTDFSKGEEVIGLELAQWTQGAHDGKVNGREYFKARHGRGYFTRKESVMNLVLPEGGLEQENQVGQSAVQIRREINKIKRTLRQIEIFEMRLQKGQQLQPQQLEQIKEKADLIKKLQQLEIEASDAGIHDKQKQEENTKKRQNLLERKATVDLTSKKWTVSVQVDDMVKLENGDTGVVKWIGKIPFLADEVIGILMDQGNPNYHNGELDGKEFFKAPNHRGYFALPEEIETNMGSTRSTGRRKSVNATEESKLHETIKIGDKVHTSEGEGTVVWKGTVPSGESGEKSENVLGIELNNFSGNCNSGVNYFNAKKGHAMLARTQSIQLDSLPDFGAEQDTIQVLVGDRVRTEKGRTGVLKENNNNNNNNNNTYVYVYN